MNAVRDWMEGDDPGMGMWAVRTSDQVAFITADIVSWTMTAYDMSADPTAAITPDLNGNNTVTNFFVAKAGITVDAFWTKDDIGYNIRHYIRNGDFTTTPLKAMHQYRFVYLIQTATFDGTAHKSGQITLVREGTCRARGGA